MSIQDFRNTFHLKSMRDLFLNYVNYFFPTQEVSKNFMFTFLNNVKNLSSSSARILLFKKLLMGEGSKNTKSSKQEYKSKQKHDERVTVYYSDAHNDNTQ